ncbi:MAG TPA: hypothetical protein VL549_07955 [Gemmatimonadales bacterium]|jgi:hypothetical protein|nr:hypothetical protein [Gemmatimonadales bacterium]
MHRIMLTSLTLLVSSRALAAQQPSAPAAARPAAPHDSVRGAVRAVDLRARTLEVTTGVGFALRVVKLQVPADVPITDRQVGQRGTLRLAELKPGDVVRATFGGRQTGFVAYVIERVGRMDRGVEATP